MSWVPAPNLRVCIDDRRNCKSRESRKGGPWGLRRTKELWKWGEHDAGAMQGERENRGGGLSEKVERERREGEINNTKDV